MSKRRRSLKPDEPLLVGRLRLPEARGFSLDSRPSLLIDVWCPYCKRHHQHCWVEDFASDAVSHRVAHCYAGPLAHDGYWIGFDPAQAEANRRTLAEFKAFRERYEAWRKRTAAAAAR
jgi:hypothetical protein